MYANITVTVQFLSLAVLVFTGPVLPQATVPLLCVILGIGLGVWALWVMRQSVFRVSPDVAPAAKLVTDGPYRIIRHPMYAAVLITGLGWLWGYPTQLRFIAYIVLCADMLWKIAYEEKALAKHFSGYGSYRKKTFRLIPYIF